MKKKGTAGREKRYFNKTIEVSMRRRTERGES
jgi:hypothetical protein